MSDLQSSVDRHKQSAAEQRLATPEGRLEFIKATLSCWLGTTMEYVDFALYGLAAGLVFTDVFFPGTDPTIGLLSSFATYSVGFAARPIGAVFFGRLGDRKGRKFVLVTTIALMGISTTLIGFIPSYATIGLWAPAMLVMLRFIQGFGAGAELSGATVMLGEYAPPKHRGLIASIIGIGSNSGTLIASAVWLLVLMLDEKDVVSWGWRIPFILSAVIAVAATLIRRHVRETPVFEQEQKELKQQTATTTVNTTGSKISFWARNKAFFVMLGLRIGENGPSYLAQGFVIGYVVKSLEVSKTVATTAVFIASLLGFLVIPFAGWLSDRYGRRIVYRWFCFLLMLYAVPAYMFLETRDPFIVGSIIVIGMCLASLGIFGVQAAYGVELFGVRNRYSKMALAKELGGIISGGTASLVASALLKHYQTWWPIAIYFAAMAGIGFFTTFFAPETRGRDLNAVEDAI
ncbi:MFS transporter [Snodgrassella communis]|uniref:L-Proline/Glycine betaine transporter ProP n=1 Tax=Snodgrassella communis TaxID=2946699 RepID=A0A066TRX6_9NEIS|nr:MFS transporter [Snodgrassella communis]KDN12158.1 L-Proline/Glycine betaine transporter ProP [Snodgrassella communis]KDN14649.1 L-Proline/Glycine betaine transporter ProP [Snodgrassella communis]PIT08169.1 MFS transporter [Snodgrassella communis]PIT26136.1 MFS transporter [Snodgrassella communis]PIT26635.1 MFS transporter [Snodgrassella communis]